MKMVLEPKIFWGLVLLLAVSILTTNTDAYGFGKVRVESTNESRDENIRENMCARLNLAVLEVIQDNEIHLRNAEEVKRVMEKVAKGPGLEGVDLGSMIGLKGNWVYKLITIVVNLVLLVIFLLFVWCPVKNCMRFQKKQKKRSEREVIGKAPNKYDLYGLRYSVGSVSKWNSELHENIIKDLELNISDHSQKTRDLWFVFDNTSPTSKLVLKKLEQVIVKFIFGGSVLVRDHVLSGNHIVDCEAM